MNATVNKHPCHNCGGEMQWNAAKQALVCPFCGTQADWAPAQVEAGGIVEHDLGSALSGVQPAMAAQQREVQCQNCNAITVFSAEAGGATLRFLRLAQDHRSRRAERCLRAREPVAVQDQ
jgi:DNA-directed RNA polymerase subunit RPC12/RpoP